MVLDTLQSDVFAEVFEDNPAYREVLTGFTFLWNTWGGADRTSRENDE